MWKESCYHHNICYPAHFKDNLELKQQRDACASIKSQISGPMLQIAGADYCQRVFTWTVL